MSDTVWTAVGMACVHEDFLKQIQKRARFKPKGRERPNENDLDRMIDFLDDYDIRVSRSDNWECQRIFSGWLARDPQVAGESKREIVARHFGTIRAAWEATGANVSRADVYRVLGLACIDSSYREILKHKAETSDLSVAQAELARVFSGGKFTAKTHNVAGNGQPATKRVRVPRFSRLTPKQRRAFTDLFRNPAVVEAMDAIEESSWYQPDNLPWPKRCSAGSLMTERYWPLPRDPEVFALFADKSVAGGNSSNGTHFMAASFPSVPASLPADFGGASEGAILEQIDRLVDAVLEQEEQT